MAATVTAIRPRTAAAQDVYLSPVQVSELVPGLSVRTLRELRASGRGPRFFKPTEKTVVYSEADVRAWVQSTLQKTREQA